MGTYLISVAIPVYNEAKQIYENINIIHKILTENNINHEFILVDDGSRDNTWKSLKGFLWIFRMSWPSDLAGISARKPLFVRRWKPPTEMLVWLWIPTFSIRRKSFPNGANVERRRL